MLRKVAYFDVATVSVWKAKASTSSFPIYYIQADGKPIELQTEWITIDKYPLPSKEKIFRRRY